MSFGPSQAETDAQKAQQQYMSQLPGYLNQGQQWMNMGLSQLDGINGKLNNYISNVGNDPNSLQMRSQLNDILAGKGVSLAAGSNAAAVLAGPASMASAATASASQAQAAQAQAMNIAMQGKTFAQQFGSDLGGLALQQKNMQTVADKLASTDKNPFAVLTKGAMEDSALQYAAGQQQLRSQLASQGLDATSGTGAAALAALQFNTSKAVADANRQNAVQGAQFQQQGLGMAGGLYNQLAGLDLQRATTAAQLGLSGYQADIGNAQRVDQVNMGNAQMATQTNLANAQSQTQASLANAQNQTQVNLANSAATNQINLANADAQTRVNMANAQGQNQLAMANAQAQNQWRLGGLQGLMQMQNSHDDAVLRAYGIMSGNSGQYLNAGSNLFGQAFGGYGNMVGMMNQNAMANAQGRGNMFGGLLNMFGTLGGAAIGALL